MRQPLTKRGIIMSHLPPDKQRNFALTAVETPQNPEFLSRADWQLPRGVSRSLWEFSQSRHIARDEAEHLAGSPLLRLDQQLLDRWLTPPGRIADLGCGTGRLAVPLAQRGFEVIGVDLSRESLQ